MVPISAALNQAVKAVVETCGAVAYFPKPFDVDELLAVVERYARRCYPSHLTANAEGTKDGVWQTVRVRARG